MPRIFLITLCSLAACNEVKPGLDQGVGANDAARAIDLAVAGDAAPPVDDARGADDLAVTSDLAPAADLAGGGGSCSQRANADVRCGGGPCIAPKSVCCRGEGDANGTCIAPGAPCPGKSIFCCDDKADCGPGEVCCHLPGGGSGCLAAAVCATRMGARMCASMMASCDPGEQCCSGIPVPPLNDYCGVMCPKSRLRYKRDVDYLTGDEVARLHDQLVRFRLGTYRYKADGSAGPRHLGFIIDDVAPSPAIDASGDRVDLYGYTSMAVAGLQEQARQIAALRRELAELRREVRARPSRR